LPKQQSFPARTHAFRAYFLPEYDGPLYVVEFGWVRTRLASLWEYPPSNAGVVRQDCRAGTLLGSYRGRLNDDYHNDENVYELGVWGFGRM
jgi:hypothetical protein